MRIFLTIFCIILSGCGCKNKATILQERQDSIAYLEKKYGEIIPEAVSDVPDFNECQI